MKAIKKIGSLSSVFLMATSLTAVFSPAASAADFPVTDATTFMAAVSSAVVGDTITVQPGSTVTLSGTINLADVPIILLGGSTLTGSATLNISGYFSAPIRVYSTAAPPVTISGLTFNDQSTSLYSATLWATSYAPPQGNTTITGCTFIGSANNYAIQSNAENNAVITNNRFISYGYPVNISSNGVSTLTLTGNTFVNSGTSLIDYWFLNPGAGSTIANNIFDSSDTLPAFQFFDQAGAGRVPYIPTEADLNAVIAANPAYPIVVDDFDGLATGGGAEVYYPGGTSTIEVVTATFLDSNGSTLTSGSVSATTITMDVTPATTLTSAQFPTVNNPKAGYNLVWTRSDGLGLTAAVGQNVTFTATWVLKASPTSVPATGSLALAFLGVLLAGLAVVRLRFRGQ